MVNDNFASAEIFSEIRDLIGRLESGLALPDLVDLLHDATRRLGVDSAHYSSVVRDGDVIVSVRSLLAGDPLWGLIHEQVVQPRDDPWLRYASRHSVPVSGSEIVVDPDAAQKMHEFASEHGFRSSFIVPIHAGGALPMQSVVRFGSLVLGSHSAGFFERAATTTLRVLARSLATELHEAYGLLLRRERIEWFALSPRDLDLLDRARAGQSTKIVARALNTTPHAIDQHFGRIGKKLGARTRQACVQLAVEFSLM